MSNSKLQLERYRLSSVSVKFNDSWLESIADRDQEEQYTCRPDFDVYETEDEELHALVGFSVACSPALETEGPTRFESIEATVWGMFRISEDTSEEERKKLIPYNAVAILHGVVRGLLIDTTGGCVGGPFILPALNYKAIIDRKLEEQEKATAEAKNRPEIRDQ